MISIPQKKTGGKIGMIAREANCSPSTVSRILNDYQKGFSARPELEARVRELARQLDYAPNPYLRAMRSQKTKIIAVFEPFVSNDGVPQKAKQQFISDIREAGYFESGKYADRLHQNAYAITFPVDGALLVDIYDSVCLNFVEEKQIPYVVVNGISSKNGASVQVDEQEDVRLLVKYLADLGHRRIAYFAGHEDPHFPPHHYSVTAREEYYQVNIDKLGLIYGSTPSDYNINPIDFLKKCVLQEHSTVVICYDHIKTVALMHAAWQLGIRIPEQLSIACFNDEYPLSQLNPPVSCIATPALEMGSCASQLLLDMIEGRIKPPITDVKIRGSLVVRQSVKRLN